MSLTKKASVGVMFGQPGSCKSWSAVRFVVNEFLVDGTGMFITNLPLKVDAICKELASTTDQTEDEVRARIHVIPLDVWDDWKEGQGNPSDYFDRLWLDVCRRDNLDPDDPEHVKAAHPLSRACVILDEARKILPAKPRKSQERFLHATFDWLATIRHEGSRIIFIAQSKSQLHKEVFALAGFEIWLANLGDMPIPYVGIRADTIFQLGAKLGLHYYQWVEQEELTVLGQRTQVTKSQRWIAGPYVFQFYDSRNKDDGTSGAEEQPEYIRFGWGRFLLWIFTSNWWPISRTALCLMAFFVLVWPVGLIFSAWQYGITHATDLFSVTPVLESAKVDSGEGEGEPPPVMTNPNELIAKVELLQATLKEAAIVITDYEIENQRLNRELESSSQMVLIDQAGIILSNGDRVNVGEPIKAGVFRGQILESVDPRNRIALLDDGHELRLREPKPLVQPIGLPSGELVAQRPGFRPTPAHATEFQGSLSEPSTDANGWRRPDNAERPNASPVFESLDNGRGFLPQRGSSMQRVDSMRR